MHHYDRGYLKPDLRAGILEYLAGLRPIWEKRYSTRRPPPGGQPQRMLLRPVYWLGNWQFACLDYYRPPKGVKDRCVEAEPFPPPLAKVAKDAEARARKIFHPRDVPEKWHLNTCLINFYGHRREGEKWVDTARVGEHRDFEPGPVASLSIGARALFQFVPSRKIGEREEPALAQWLDDGSLQLFAGKKFKDDLFHRVQRVDRSKDELPPRIEDFRTRRVNFTFRYVPDEHVIPYGELGARAKEDVREYVETLAEGSAFFRLALR